MRRGRLRRNRFDNHRQKLRRGFFNNDGRNNHLFTGSHLRLTFKRQDLRVFAFWQGHKAREISATVSFNLRDNRFINANLNHTARFGIARNHCSAVSFDTHDIKTGCFGRTFHKCRLWRDEIDVRRDSNICHDSNLGLNSRFWHARKSTAHISCNGQRSDQSRASTHSDARS